ncbi:Agamous-like MADS-box protein AGL36 [Linum grandiflorum]
MYFQKRRAGLIKKVKELSTLYGVQGMYVIYSPYEEPSPFQPWLPPEPPTVWPSRESAVQLMQRFMALPGVERSKKMFNQYEYVDQYPIMSSPHKLTNMCYILFVYIKFFDRYLREVIMKAEEKQS